MLVCNINHSYCCCDNAHFLPSVNSFFPMQQLTLQGLVSGVEVSVVDAESLKVEDSLVHKCTFPVRELLGTQQAQTEA